MVVIKNFLGCQQTNPQSSANYREAVRVATRRRRRGKQKENNKAGGTRVSSKSVKRGPTDVGRHRP